jgi:hypothetical protein
MAIQRDRRLTEIGRYYGSIDEFVIGRMPAFAGFAAAAGRKQALQTGSLNMHLPQPTGGAIILESMKEGAA